MADIEYKAHGPDGDFIQKGQTVIVDIAGQKIRAARVVTKTTTKLVHVGSGMVMHEVSSVHKPMSRHGLLDSFRLRIQGKDQTVLSVIRAQENRNPVPKGFL